MTQPIQSAAMPSSILTTCDFKLIFEACPHPYLIVLPNEPTYTIVAVNDSYLLATHTERSHIVGRALFEVFPDNPDDNNATGVNDLRASLEKVIAEKTQDYMGIQKYDIPIHDSQHEFEVRYWSPINSPVLDANGEVNLIIHRVEDVTEFVQLKQGFLNTQNFDEKELELPEQIEAEVIRTAHNVKEINRQLKAANKILGQKKIELQMAHHEIEDALAETEQRFKSIFNQSSVGIAQTDMSGRFVLVNDHYCEMVARSKEELSGLQIQDIIHPYDLAGDPIFFDKAIKEELPFMIEKRYIRPDLTEVWSIHNISIIKDSEQKPQYMVIVSQDITARKQVEQELLQLKNNLEQRVNERTEQLQLLNKKWEDLQYAITHQLRAPIRTIDGITNSLHQMLSEKLGEKEKQYLVQLQANCQLMNNLLKDLI